MNFKELHSSAPKKRESALIQLARRALQYKKTFLLIAAFACLASLARVVEPLIYKFAINDVAGVFVKNAIEKNTAIGQEYHHIWKPHLPGIVSPRTSSEAMQTLFIAIALLFFTGFVFNIFSYLAENKTTRVANRIEGELMLETFRHVLAMPMRFFGKRPSGGIAKQIDQVDQVSPVITIFSEQIGPEIIRVIGALVVMFTQSPSLTLLALLPLPLYVFVVYRSTRVLGTRLDEYYDLWQNLNSRINEVFSSIKTVMISGSEQREWDHFKAQSQKAYDTAYWRSRRENWYLFWQEFLVQCSRVMVLGLGCWRVFEHQLTPGDVVMFVAYISEIYDPVESLSGLGITIQEHTASFGRALRLLKEPAKSKKGHSLREGTGLVEFNNVHFGYTHDREVLKGVSLILEPGKITGLVGPSGAGKTTLADLILRLYEPHKGTISIDGQNLAETDISSLRSAIAVVATDGAVFHGSLDENIRYKRPQATKVEVEEAAQMAGLGQTIERLPHGLKTEIGERGMGLSVGERQRLQIARAFVSRPRLLILDEATANLDFATERDIKAAIESMRGRWTTLVIAHRYSMVRSADFIGVLDNGVIAETGTPADLSNTGGWFSLLAKSAQEKGPV